MKTLQIDINTKSITPLIALIVIMVPISILLNSNHQNELLGSDNLHLIPLQTENQSQNPKNELIKTFDLSLEKISNLMTIRLFKNAGKSGISAEIDGNNEPIKISGNLDYNSIMGFLIKNIPKNQKISNIKISNAPGSIIENLNYGEIFRYSQRSENFQIKMKQSFNNYTGIIQKTPLSITKSNDSIIQNNLFVNISQNTISAFKVEGSSNVTISNNIFAHNSASSGIAYGIKIEPEIEVDSNLEITAIYYSDDIYIQNNIFTNLTGITGSIGIELSGLELRKFTNILLENNSFYSIKSTSGVAIGFNIKSGDGVIIANNTMSDFSTLDEIEGISLHKANNVSIFNNDISSINTPGSFISIKTNLSSKITIANNSNTFINTDFEITGIKASSTTNLVIENNTFSWFTSVDGNITGIQIDGSNGFIINNNVLEQYTASYSSFDFSGIKHIYAIKAATTSNSLVTNNYINQLNSKSKAYGMYFNDITNTKVENNTVNDITGKSSLGILVPSGTNPNLVINNNTITQLVSTATESIGISVLASNDAQITFNTIVDISSESKMNGIILTNSNTATIANNTLKDFSTSSPIYNLVGIYSLNSNTSIIENNSLQNYNSVQTFVQGIVLELNEPGTIKSNSIRNLKTTFSSAFGIVLDNSYLITIELNSLYNITSTAQASFVINKLSTINVDLSSGYGLFIYKSNEITITSNEIDQTDIWLNADETVTIISFNLNTIDGTPLTFKNMTHPLDFTFEQGTLAQNIPWTAFDDSASTFQIFVDSIEVSSGFWFSGIPIVYGVADVSDLTLGPHQVQIVLTDENDHKITDIVNVNVIELEPPTITETSNKTILNGTLGNTISWVGNDLNPGTYSIFQDDFEVESAVWTSDFPINYQIDDLNVGEYNFTIVVSDSSGNLATNTLFVFVLTNATLTFTIEPTPTKLINFGSTNESLSWTLQSVTSGTYTIHVDSLLKQSGPWLSEVPINFSLKNLALGEHDIKFEATNDFDIKLSDNLLITVIIPQKTTSTEEIIVPTLFSNIPSQGGLLDIIKIDTGSLFFILIFGGLIFGTFVFMIRSRKSVYKSNIYVNKTEKVEKFIELGNAYLKMGDILSAIKNFKRSLKGAEKIGNTHLKALSLKSLGEAALSLYSTDDETLNTSRIHLEEALGLAKKLNEKNLQVECLSLLGDCFSNFGEVKEAIQNYEKGISLSKETDDEKSEINILTKLGIYYEVLDNKNKAKSSYEDALKIAKSVKDTKTVASLEHSVANVLRDQRDFNKAHEHYKQAISSAKKYNDITTEAKVMGDMGRAYYLDGDMKKAMSSFNASIDLANGVGDEQIEAFQRHNLAIIDFDNADYKNCIEKIDHSLKFEKLSVFYDLKGDALIGLSKINKAVSNYKQAFEIAKNANDKLQQIDTVTKLLEIQQRLGNKNQIKEIQKQFEILNEDLELYNKKISSRKNSSLRVRTKELDIKIMKLIETNVIKGKSESEPIIEKKPDSTKKGDKKK